VRDYYENPEVFAEARKVLGDKFFKFRQIRFFMASGKFIKIKRRMGNWEELRQTILKNCTNDDAVRKVYYSISKFLNPERVGYRAEQKREGRYMVADNLFLMQEQFVFDVEKFSEGLKLLKFCYDVCWKIVYAIESGGGGMHVCIDRSDDVVYLENSRDREEVALALNRKMVDAVRSARIDVDNCVINTRQVIKVPCSLSVEDDGALKVCAFANIAPEKSAKSGIGMLDDKAWGSPALSSFQNSIRKTDDVRTSVKKAGFRARKTRLNENWSNRQLHSSEASVLEVDEELLNIGIRSSVMGTNGLHVPVMKFDFTQLDIVEKIIEERIAKYKLSDVYVYNNGERFFALALKTVDIVRYRKICRYVHSTGAILPLNNLELISVLEGEKSEQLSKGHAMLLGLQGTVGDSRVGVIKW